MNPKEKKIIRANELAQLLGISNTTLWRWRRSNAVPQPIYLGPRMIGWRVEDINSWLENASAKGGI